MGLGPLPLKDWLKPRAGDDALLAERARLLAAHGDDVMAARPESIDAVTELIALLRTRGFNVDTLRDVGQNVAEDICILTTTDKGYGLTAGLLCFPNRWKLREKLGGSLLDIHGPVPDYAGDLSAGVDRFLERLRPSRAYVRGNWGLASMPDLYLPESVPPVDPETDTGFFIRRETQSFLKLPETGAVIFSIRTTVSPWENAPADERAGMLETIAGLSPAWLDYKSIRRKL